jgi:hypothetical protein
VRARSQGAVEQTAASGGTPLTLDDLPEPHVRLIAAVLFYRAGLITEQRLHGEIVAAFGSAGSDITRLILEAEPAAIEP